MGICSDDGEFVHWGITPQSVQTSDNLQYILEDNKVLISGYLYPETHITIPSEIDGYSVTEITKLAFTLSPFEEIILPEGLEVIQYYAFTSSRHLKSIIIPSTVTAIGSNAFSSSDVLQFAYIPSSVSSMGEGVFLRNSHIIIMTERSSRPMGWDSTWNGNGTVYWDVSQYIVSDNLLLSIGDDNTARLLKYMGNESTIILPKTIDGYTLKMIETQAIRSGEAGLSVVIPESVDYINQQGIYFTNSDSKIFIEHESIPSTWDSQWFYRGTVYLKNSWELDSDGNPVQKD